MSLVLFHLLDQYNVKILLNTFKWNSFPWSGKSCLSKLILLSYFLIGFMLLFLQRMGNKSYTKSHSSSHVVKGERGLIKISSLCGEIRNQSAWDWKARSCFMYLSTGSGGLYTSWITEIHGERLLIDTVGSLVAAHIEMLIKWAYCKITRNFLIIRKLLWKIKAGKNAFWYNLAPPFCISR